MDTCEKEVLLSGRLDGELSAAEQEELDGHLRVCARCRELLDGLQRIEEALHTVPLPRPEQWEARWRNIVRALPQPAGAGQRPQPAVTHSLLDAFRQRWVLGLAVAATVALAAFGMLYVAMVDDGPVAPTPGPPSVWTPVELASPASVELEIEQPAGAPMAMVLLSEDGDVSAIWVATEAPPLALPDI